ncbi:hypothetical protein SAMN02990966_06936 [Rhodospirillales bacterium URHD0017]|nr:hypothetical protein SAMN02990966_06936 [Rhodospirillales bacterium URHD0017]
MTDDLQAAAHQIVEAIARDFPAEAAAVASLVLVDILAVGLHGEDNDSAATAAFVAAVNFKLGEVALHYGADSAWRLTPCDVPTRQ